MLGKLILALSLVAVIPLLVAAYGLYVSPRGGVGSALRAPSTWSLLALAALSALAGGRMLWRLLTPATRAGPGVTFGSAPLAAGDAAASQARPSLPPRRAAGSGIADGLALPSVLTTIEQQSAEINQYASRLDSAYREIETSSARLKEFSFKDEVTGLYNRRFFSIRLEEEVSRYRRFDHPVSVVLIDLDRFKAVNDELGHGAGDETLRGFADILLKHSRGINVICRYGGDEFAVLLVETSKAGARRTPTASATSLPSYRFDHGRRVTASFGIASLPEDVAPSPDELIRAADEALYAAKRAGKNRVSLHGDIRAPRSSEGRPESPSGSRPAAGLQRGWDSSDDPLSRSAGNVRSGRRFRRDRCRSSPDDFPASRRAERLGQSEKQEDHSPPWPAARRALPQRSCRFLANRSTAMGCHAPNRTTPPSGVGPSFERRP